MEIELTQFGCYYTKTKFSFPNTGLILLNGDSGQGKTTILNGINFALFGVGSKVISWGERKCKVVLRYDGWTITRGKGPNHLVLVDEKGDEYEEDCAQKIIDNKFGVNFNITSYITQKGLDTFFNLGPSERISFLEKIALGDSDVSEIKRKCKFKIKERKDKLNEYVGELKVITDECSNLKEPLKVDFPIEGKYSDIKIKNESDNCKKNTLSLSLNRKELSLLKEKKNKAELSKQKKDGIDKQESFVTNQITHLDNELGTIILHDMVEIESRINYLKSINELSQLISTYNNENSQYKGMCEIEIFQMSDDYDNLVNGKVDIKDISSELIEKINLKGKFIKVNEKIFNITSELDEMDTVENYISVIDSLKEDELRFIKQLQYVRERKTIHECPNCKTFLRVENGSLEIARMDENVEYREEKEILDDIKKVKKEMEEYNECYIEVKKLNFQLKKANKEKELLGEFNYTENYESIYSDHRDVILEQESRKNRAVVLRRRIDNKEFSLSLQSMNRKLECKLINIKKLEMTISGYGKKCNLPNMDDVDKLQEMLVSSRLTKQNYDILTKQINQLKQQKINLSNQLKEIITDKVDYDELIDNKIIEIKENEELEIEYKERGDKITLYMNYKKEIEQYNKWTKKLEDSKESERNAKLNLTVSEKLLKIILETEGTAVMNVIENINNNLKLYLEKFFSDPILVEISSFKEKNNGDRKPIVNIQVGYKGCECDISSLSGGERARVELAICLAINSIVGGGKLLLFDEVLSSLNSEKIEDITEVLRNEARDGGKLIICILHQAVRGEFDECIDTGGNF